MTNREQTTHLIVGLGNPGKRYKLNRHNAGFLLLDRIAGEMRIAFSKSRGQALIAEQADGSHRIILAKPQTFMNLAGNSIRQLLKLYQAPLEHLLVAFDELDLELGMLRMRPGGGSSGHNGMRSIIQQLGVNHFPRLRIGIGRPPKGVDPAVYVLQDFTSFELSSLELTLQRGTTCVQHFIEQGIEHAMNTCNAGSEP